MNNNHYTDNQLHLMSYQDLRKLSTLLQLPANIKKKYMISMIQAHQKGDGCMKTAIANKIMEERKVKRMNNKKKQSKSYIIDTSVSSEQIPTDLSVSTHHEFETRFSYVAHYTSKDDISSGISRIMKQETEVSRRNRSILQQPRKSTRKISTSGRTEIMLPRNHSLTTPVRLMPQYERGFSSNEFEAMSNTKNHFQDLSYNYHFHGEFSNSLIPTTSHDLFRNEPYWHTREIYNNTLMPILSSLLSPNSAAINSGFASQYTTSSTLKNPNSFQEVYENYIKSNNLVETQAHQSATNSSTLILNNLNESNGSFNVNRGGFTYSKNEVDLNSAPNELNCQHCSRRSDAVMKTSHESQNILDFYTRNPDFSINSQTSLVANTRDMSQYSAQCFRTDHKDMSLSNRCFDPAPVICYKSTEIVEPGDHETPTPVADGYESSYTEEDRLWESEGGLKKLIGRSQIGKENFSEALLSSQNLPEISDASTNISADMSDKLSKTNGKEMRYYMPNFPRCRYILGHNKHPETVGDSNKITVLPSFLSTFSSNEFYNKAYSVCKNSFTGTTETHVNPIMTSTYASQFIAHTNPQQAQVNNTSNGLQMQRQWHYNHPDSQVPFSVNSSYPLWNEFSNGMDSKVIAQNNNVQVVKCRTHGCHYVYSIANSCD